MKTIEISHNHKRQLATEFNVSIETIRMSLGYVFNSDKNKKIRARAKELLLTEAKKIKDAV